MTTDPSPDLAALIDRYVDAWNETDAPRRRQLIETLWRPDGMHATATLHAQGFDEIEARITDANRRFVIEGGHRFQIHQPPDGHHGTARFVWAMQPAAGGPPAALGFDFFLLDDDGRLRADFQYPQPT